MTANGQIPTSAPAASYSHWVRKMLRHNARNQTQVALFESAVPEPVELLRQTISAAFADKISSRYVSAFADGNPFVVAALARRLGVEEGQILCTTGATGALSLICRALLKPGQRLLVETPAFDLFHRIARSLDRPVDYFSRRGPRYEIDPDEVRKALTPDTRIILLSNLHNPSGMALDRETLVAIGRVAEDHGAVVVVDEVYADYGGPGFVTASPGLSPAFIRVGSLTKGFGLSTLRCGWITADQAVLAPIRALSEEVEFGVSRLAHAVAALVLENPQPFDRWRADMMASARPIIESWHGRWLADGLMAGDLPPHGCITFPRPIGIDSCIRFAQWLADRSGVVVAPGAYFGAPGHIRIGFALPAAELDAGLQALTDGLQLYRAQFAGKRDREET